MEENHDFNFVQPHMRAGWSKIKPLDQKQKFIEKPSYGLDFTERPTGLTAQHCDAARPERGKMPAVSDRFAMIDRVSSLCIPERMLVLSN